MDLYCAFMAIQHTHWGHNSNYGMLQNEWNKAMSSARRSVEWLFGDAINRYKFLHFCKNLKIQLSVAGKV